MSEILSPPSIKHRSASTDSRRLFGNAFDSSSQAAAKNLNETIPGSYNLPPATALLGMSSDGLPVLFDLTDPNPGPLLILGNEGCGKTQLMQKMALSLIQNNPAEGVQFSVIGHNLPRWGKVIAKARMNKAWLDLTAGKKPDAGEQLITVAEMTEQRFLNKKGYPPAVIFVDDLSFIFNQSAPVQLNFEWLCKNGPLVQVWLVASLETQAALSMGRWIRYFRTRIIGEMPKKASDRLGLYPGSGSEDFIPGIEFAVYIQDAWLRFELPDDAHPQPMENDNV